jgi:transcriptional regulator with XRE-family HTH domain
MNDAQTTRLRQRIGPALRELRTRQGWSLEEFARRCGVSDSYLSRLERGWSVPSFIILSRLAQVLGVDVTYFTTFERTAQELDNELVSCLKTLALPPATWDEFFGLSMEARGAILGALREVVVSKIDARSSIREVESFVIEHGVEASIPLILSAINRVGLSADDFTRNLIQLEELPGDRLVVTTQITTLPAADRFDQLYVFRSAFGADPPDPLLLKWWVKAQQSALASCLRTSESRTIYSRTQIERYLRTGCWGTNLTVEPEVVHAHVRATNDLLLGCDRYHVGLLDPIPIAFFVKGTDGVLVRALDSADAGSGSEGIALRFSGPAVTSRFREYFEQLWGSIPTKHKASEAVADWLEVLLPAIGDRHRPS